jgi:hypothetical protein
MVLVHSRPIVVTHHANRVSCASCWSACYVLLLIILPYIVAYAMGAFWTKEAFEREQPNVRFRHEALVEAYLADGTALGWSTSDKLNTALGARMRPCQLRAWAEDDERDGKPEALQFVLRLPLDEAAGERLHGLTLLLGVEAAYAAASGLRLNGACHTVSAADSAAHKPRRGLRGCPPSPSPLPRALCRWAVR